METSKLNIKKIISSPITLFFCIVAGILVGTYYKGSIEILELFSKIYMSLLQMCVVPLVFAAVVVNISVLLSKEFRNVLTKIIVAAVAVLIISSIFGTLTAYSLRSFLKPNQQMIEAIAMLQGGDDATSSVPEFTSVSYYNSVDEASEHTVEYKPTDFLLNIVPKNIFAACTNGDILGIIFFSLITGIMLSFIDKEKAEGLKRGLEGTYQIFCKFINYLLTFLPVGMFSILAVQFSQQGMAQIIRPLMRLILTIYLACVVIIIFVFIMIQMRTKCSLKTHLNAIQRAFFLSISTSSCIATLAVVTEDIIKHFKLKEKLIRSVMPITITTIQSGVIASSAVIVVFAALLYDVPLTLNALTIIIIGSIFYAFSIIGVPGIVAATMIGLVVEPLGIPSQVISIIMISIVMFFDPIAVFASVYCSVGISTCIVPKEDNPTMEAKDE